MRSIFSKIDPLIVFLLIAIVIFGSSSQVQSALKGENSVLKKFELLENLVHLPDSAENSIFPYDNQFNLFYSLDGGDNFLRANKIEVTDLFYSNLSKYLISFRSKPPYGEQPILPTLLLKCQHKTKDVFSEPKLVTFNSKENHSLPIINVVSGEQGLFSDQSGIMALGMDSWFNEGLYKPFWNQNANYKRRGANSKRMAYWQFIKNGMVVYEAQADLQVSGNATRSFAQKSLKLKANRLYGEPYFKYRFFGKKGLKKYSSLVIRNSGNDNVKTLFADLIMHDLARKTNVLIQKGKPIVLYLNGNYWGIYNLRERIDLHFISEKENAKISDITILEGGNGELKDGDTEQVNTFRNLIKNLNSSAPNESFSNIQNQVDLNSFIDYIVLETFYGNGDWLHNNALWYKVEGEKWKWILNDIDYGLTYQGGDNLTKNYFNYLSRNNTLNSQLFNFLIENPSFKIDLKKRGEEILIKYFSNKTINKRFNKVLKKLETEIDRHINRWTGVLTKSDWESNVESNLVFLHKRKKIYLKQLEEL